ncbi:MAG: hypothetical protein DMF53_10335 [Acidobacteria bacterium]|nr:MAG: hypothetical protein DMF53_10335 [Acidobacteriota bacterium]
MQPQTGLKISGQTSGRALHSPLPLHSPAALAQYCFPLHCLLVAQALPAAGSADAAGAACSQSGASNSATLTPSAQEPSWS